MTRIGAGPRPALALHRGCCRGGPDLRRASGSPHGRGPASIVAAVREPRRPAKARKVSSASAPWTSSTEWPRSTRSSRVGWPRCWSPRTRRSARERSCCVWRTAIARSRLAEAEAAVMLAQLQLRQARKQPELHRIRVAQQQAMRDAMASRVAAARRVLAREEKLAKSVVITESDRSISEEKIREMEALERAEAERLAELEAQDVEVEIRRAEHELKAAEARREQARLALEECRLQGTAARHRPPHPGRPGRRAGRPAGSAGRAVRRRRPAGDPRHGRAGVRAAASRKASPLWSATRPIPPPPGAAGSGAWPVGTVSAARSCTTPPS